MSARLRRPLLFFGVLALAGCGEDAPVHGDDELPETSTDAPAPFGDAVRGAELAVRFECARCHEGVSDEPLPREKQCVGCHVDILSGELDAPAATLERWQRNIHSLPITPDLRGATRFDPEWVAAFLLDPMDLRPHLEATMPQLDLDETDARDLAAFLTQEAPQPRQPSSGDAGRGAIAIRQRACGSCHLLGGQTLGEHEPVVGDSRTLAPDLAFAAHRFRTDLLVDWLVNPSSLNEHTLMPNQGVSRAEAADIAAYLRQPHDLARIDLPERLPVLERDVGFDEVESALFRAVCWHCHSDPDLALGDGGPGNTGGFGFSGRHVNLGDYGSVMSGGMNDEGQRRSLFRTVSVNGESMPLLVAVLRTRQLEEAGVEHDGPRGMPLGLPSIAPSTIQLVETWIARGRHE